MLNATSLSVVRVQPEQIRRLEDSAHERIILHGDPVGDHDGVPSSWISPEGERPSGLKVAGSHGCAEG